MISGDPNELIVLHSEKNLSQYCCQFSDLYDVNRTVPFSGCGSKSSMCNCIVICIAVIGLIMDLSLSGYYFIAGHLKGSHLDLYWVI